MVKAMLLVWVELHESRHFPWHTQRLEKPWFSYGLNCLGLDVFSGIYNDRRSHATDIGRTAWAQTSSLAYTTMGEAMLLIWVELHGSRRLPWHTKRWESHATDMDRTVQV